MVRPGSFQFLLGGTLVLDTSFKFIIASVRSKLSTIATYHQYYHHHHLPPTLPPTPPSTFTTFYLGHFGGLVFIRLFTIAFGKEVGEERGGAEYDCFSSDKVWCQENLLSGKFAGQESSREGEFSLQILIRHLVCGVRGGGKENLFFPGDVCETLLPGKFTTSRKTLL